jgi:hypothetical protein
MKKGDKIICIDNSNSNILELGEIYTAYHVREDTVRLEEIGLFDYYQYRFLTKNDIRKLKLNKLYNDKETKV